ncbi:PH domain-containing protein [Streptomyces sp. TRM43335]|uniref:PH domain-containing protein n=1 Tax=Streptomyces taklimakanensis TaxID=2569853 RepID=A0A6G2BF96_9ACTN|nr:PH domain-containing protein [Streptomyces taklimakanensis]MTE20733.1 PH domain-containing protein [Streptomyces taklimakanensis]
MSEQPGYADHVYRSGSALVGGALLLALVVLLCGEGAVNGEGRVRWVSLAALLCLAPLVVAFSLRPAVYAGRERLRVRNPFRTITLPWGAVDDVRAGYSTEVFAAGRKYQMWAIPVSLRQRKKALRQSGGGRPPLVPSRPGAMSPPAPGGDHRARADQAVEEIRGLAERHSSDDAAQGSPNVRWAYEIIAPTVVGAAALLLLIVLG